MRWFGIGLAVLLGTLSFLISGDADAAPDKATRRVKSLAGYTDIAPGTTVTGTIGNTLSATGGLRGAVASFPVNLAQVLGPTDVIMATTTELLAACPTLATCLAPEEVSDSAASCTGTTATPTAPEGKLCIYPLGVTNAMQITAAAIPTSGTTQGFEVTWAAASTATDTTSFVAVWAYTAPSPGPGGGTPVPGGRRGTPASEGSTPAPTVTSGAGGTGTPAPNTTTTAAPTTSVTVPPTMTTMPTSIPTVKSTTPPTNVTTPKSKFTPPFSLTVIVRTPTIPPLKTIKQPKITPPF